MKTGRLNDFDDLQDIKCVYYIHNKNTDKNYVGQTFKLKTTFSKSLKEQNNTISELISNYSSSDLDLYVIEPSDSSNFAEIQKELNSIEKELLTKDGFEKITFSVKEKVKVAPKEGKLICAHKIDRTIGQYDMTYEECAEMSGLTIDEIQDILDEKILYKNGWTFAYDLIRVSQKWADVLRLKHAGKITL